MSRRSLLKLIKSSAYRVGQFISSLRNSPGKIAEQDHLMAFNDDDDDQLLKIAISAINGAVSQEHFSFNWKLLLTLAVWELGMRYCINGEYRELVMRKIRLGDHSPFVGLGSR